MTYSILFRISFFSMLIKLRVLDEFVICWLLLEYCSYYLPMQHVELFNYENFTLKTVENLFLLVSRQKKWPFLPFQRSFSGVMEKQSLFHEPTLARCMRMQVSACSLTRGFSIQKFTSFSKCEGTIFLSYYRQLLSTKCIEIV